MSTCVHGRAVVFSCTHAMRESSNSATCFLARHSNERLFSGRRIFLLGRLIPVLVAARSYRRGIQPFAWALAATRLFPVTVAMSARARGRRIQPRA